MFFEREPGLGAARSLCEQDNRIRHGNLFESRRLGQRQRTNRHHRFARHPERLPRRRQDPNLALPTVESLHKRGYGVEDVFTVVQHQQQTSACQRVDELICDRCVTRRDDPQRGGDQRSHARPHRHPAGQRTRRHPGSRPARPVRIRRRGGSCPNPPPPSASPAASRPSSSPSSISSSLRPTKLVS